MAGFNWDKAKFGELTPEVEEVINQAINFGKKSSEVKASEIEKEKASEIEELRTQLNEMKNKTELEKVLGDVPESNRKVVSKLLGGDPTKLEEIKKEYGELFKVQETPIIKMEELLNGKFDGKAFVGKKTDEELKTAYESGAELTPEETKRLWETIAKK